MSHEPRFRRAGPDDFDVIYRDRRTHLPHEVRPRALALDDQVVGAAARPERRRG